MVIQALVFSLFATLLVRLWYLQVVTGEEYTAQAASQSVREIVVQPQRGLIVDDQGRPLVTNRTSWVVSIDRGTLAKMPDDEQLRVLRRVAKVTGRQGRPDPAQAADLRRRGQQDGGLLERLADPAGARSPSTCPSRRRCACSSSPRTSRP